MELIPVNPHGAKALFSYSPAMVAGDFVFVSGQGAIDADGHVVAPDDAYEQTIVTIERIGTILAEAGSRLDRVVSCTAFISSLTHLKNFNRGWEKAFAGHKPTRATVVADLLLEGLAVEIQAVAVR